MKNKIMVVSIFLALLITTVSTCGLNIQNNNLGKNIKLNMIDDNDAELPVWDVGDSWTYEFVLDGGVEGLLEAYNLKFSNFKFVVDEVQDEYYKMDVSSDVSGSVSIEFGITFSGSFRSTTLQGEAYVNKSSLALISIENLLMSGYLKPAIAPQVAFDMNGRVSISYGKPLLDFPINRGDMLFVDLTSINVNSSVELGSLFSENLDITVFVQDHFMNCDKWESLDLKAGSFDAIKINQTDVYPLSENTHSVWFSPAAGNIVKVESREIPFSGGSWGYYDIDVELISTNFEPDSNVPNKPEKPSGPNVVDVGTEVEFESSSTDPDGDILKLIIDWDDGDITQTDFIQSGEAVSIPHTWDETENSPYVVKVKAKDKYGKESDWSEGLDVYVVNDAPEKPKTPDGPSGGRGGYFGKTYTYTTSSNDPNSHQIKYGWDWDGDKVVDQWTRYYESDEDVSASHKWNTKGTYEIRVKAVDEYDAESNWSDPLDVSMPKTKTIEFSLLQRLKNLLPILEPIIEKIRMFL